MAWPNAKDPKFWLTDNFMTTYIYNWEMFENVIAQRGHNLIYVHKSFFITCWTLFHVYSHRLSLCLSSLYNNMRSENIISSKIGDRAIIC